MATTPPRSFLARHEFLLLRLHSLSGLVPVGAYMVVHLLTNASVNDSPGAFQRAVYQIHSLGAALPLVEWLFIFLPILFHGLLGLVIVSSGVPNSGTYAYASNIRYTLQRATGLVAFAFIAWHVFHMHGWFHSQWWIDNVANPYLGARFKPYNAASTSASALQASIMIQALYAVGVLACVFHLANGLWTMGITWGLWITPAAQQRASVVCGGIGAVLAVVSIAALVGMVRVDVDAAREIEQTMYEARIDSGQIEPNEHKRAGASPHSGDEQGVARSSRELD